MSLILTILAVWVLGSIFFIVLDAIFNDYPF